MAKALVVLLLVVLQSSGMATAEEPLEGQDIQKLISN